jgi:hypothetical protein
MDPWRGGPRPLEVLAMEAAQEQLIDLSLVLFSLDAIIHPFQMDPCFFLLPLLNTPDATGWGKPLNNIPGKGCKEAGKVYTCGWVTRPWKGTGHHWANNHVRICKT